MNNPLRLCDACRYQVKPPPPLPFTPTSRKSGGITESGNDHQEDQFNKRKIEEGRVAEGYPFDSEPEFFPWCRKLTMSKEEAEGVRLKLMAGDDTAARQALAKDRIIVDYANGSVLPIYVTCTRANPSGECAEFLQR
jgi:hypothetical protein